MGIHFDTLSIVDDLDFFNTYPWGIVCFKPFIKSLIHRWGRKTDLAKVNDCDRMSYTLSIFPLDVQLWVYKAIPELGARFSSKIGDHIPRMLRVSGTRQPQLRTYSDFFDKTHLQLWATLHANAEEELQPYFFELVPFKDVTDPVLDSLVLQSTQIHDCPPEDVVLPSNENNQGKKAKRANTSGLWLCDFNDDEGGEGGHRNSVDNLPSSSSMGNRPTVRHVSLDEIRVLFTEHKDMLELKLGDMREEMNMRFNGIEKEMRDHVCCMKDHITVQINMMKRRFEDVVIEIRGQKASDEYGGFGCGNGR